MMYVCMSVCRYVLNVLLLREPICSCLFGLLLSVNYVRYAFGVDIKFDNSQMYTYDLKGQYIVGEAAKSPRFFRRFYDLPDTLLTKSPSNYQAVASLTLADGSTGFFSPTDLTLFFNTFGVPPPGLVDMQGATNDPSRVDIETQLDIQWITAIGEVFNALLFAFFYMFPIYI